MLTRSRSSLLSFSSFSLTQTGPCRPESPIEALNSGSPKSMNDHKHQNTCMAKNHALMIHFTQYGMQVLWCYAFQKYKNKKNGKTGVSRYTSNLMLHPDPKLIHLSEILQHKFHSIHYCVLSSGGKKNNAKFKLKAN